MQPQPPADEKEIPAEEDPFEDFPALKTDSCSVRRSLAHLGQAIFCDADSTMDS